VSINVRYWNQKTLKDVSLAEVSSSARALNVNLRKSFQLRRNFFAVVKVTDVLLDGGTLIKCQTYSDFVNIVTTAASTERDNFVRCHCSLLNHSNEASMRPPISLLLIADQNVPASQLWAILVKFKTAHRNNFGCSAPR
jgi:hypothetical protein